MSNRVSAVLSAAAAALSFGANAAVSVTIGEPGFYGRIDIGEMPQPEVVYAEPVIIQQVHVVNRPVYLHVPPGHEKHWSRYCASYHACNRPVYFVRDKWYNHVYVPAYRERRERWEREGHGHDDHHGPGPGHGPGPRPDHGPGHGPDHGPGHGPDHDH